MEERVQNVIKKFEEKERIKNFKIKTAQKRATEHIELLAFLRGKLNEDNAVKKIRGQTIIEKLLIKIEFRRETIEVHFKGNKKELIEWDSTTSLLSSPDNTSYIAQILDKILLGEAELD